MLSGKHGNIYLSAAAAGTPFALEATTANIDRTGYQISDVTKHYWDPRVTVTVYEDGSALAPSAYTLAYAGGKIIFTVARDVGAVITVSGASITCSEFAKCYSWSMDLATDMIELPRFQADWKEYVDGQTGATGSFSKWFTTAAGGWFLTRLTEKAPVLLLLHELDTDLNTVCYETMAYLSGDGIKLMVDGAVEEAVEFTTVGAINYVNTF